MYELCCVPTWDVNKHLQGRRLVSDLAVGTDRYGGNLMGGELEYAVPSSPRGACGRQFDGARRSVPGSFGRMKDCVWCSTALAGLGLFRVFCAVHVVLH